MAEKYRHYKQTMDKDFIGAYVLPNEKPIRVTISHVEEKDVKVAGHMKHAAIAYFKPNPYFDKPFILSSSKNMERLTEWFGTPNIFEWKDLDVVLQQEEDKHPKGGMCMALRIRPKAEMTPKSAGWAKSVEWLKAGGDNTIDALLKNVKISSGDLIKLKKESGL